MKPESKEIELKLRVASEDIGVLKKHPRFAGILQNPANEKLVSVYFNSDDFFLRDHGLTLRVRHIGRERIQTIKATHKTSGFFERSEWEKSVEGDGPDLEDVKDTTLASILTDNVRNALRPVFETRIERTTYHLNGGSTNIVMAIDRGEIVVPGSSCPVSEIELELKHGSPADLFKIAHAISDIVPAQLDVKSKSERGYDLLENNPIAAEKACDLDLVPGMSTGRAFTLIGRACLRQLVANEPATQRRDSEALHQMRIALRRLRAAISLFSDVVSDDRVAIIKAELKWLGSEFGPARDLDSFILEVLKPLRKQQADEPGLVSIGKMFARERLKSYRRAQDAVQSARFRKLVIDTAEWIEAGPWNTSEDPLQAHAGTCQSRTTPRNSSPGGERNSEKGAPRSANWDRSSCTNCASKSKRPGMRSNFSQVCIHARKH